MPWAKLDDSFSNHPKVLQAGPLAIALWVAGVNYASRYLTDGFIPEAALPTLVDFSRSGVTAYMMACQLVEARAGHEYGLWEEVEGGYQIHDYLDYNPSREQVLAERAKGKQRIAEARARKKGGSPDVRPNIAGTTPEQQAKFAGSSDCPVPVPVPVPEKVVSLSERAHAREEAAAAAEPPRSSKGWRWAPPEMQPYLAAWRRAGARRGPSGPLAGVVLEAIASEMSEDLVAWIVGEMARRTHLPMSDLDHVGDEAAYASGIIDRLLAADPPVTTLEQYQARDAEFRVRIESKRARAAPGEEVELEYGKFR